MSEFQGFHCDHVTLPWYPWGKWGGRPSLGYSSHNLIIRLAFQKKNELVSIIKGQEAQSTLPWCVPSCTPAASAEKLMEWHFCVNLCVDIGCIHCRRGEVLWFTASKSATLLLKKSGATPCSKPILRNCPTPASHSGTALISWTQTWRQNFQQHLTRISSCICHFITGAWHYLDGRRVLKISGVWLLKKSLSP